MGGEPQAAVVEVADVAKGGRSAPSETGDGGPNLVAGAVRDPAERSGGAEADVLSANVDERPQRRRVLNDEAL